MLQNEKGIWTSDQEWNFKNKDDLIYIENISKTEVLGSTSDGNVFFENFEENKTEQLWKKGKPNAEGYFTLQNAKVQKVMTAVSSSGLKIRGDIITL